MTVGVGYALTESDDCLFDRLIMGRVFSLTESDNCLFDRLVMSRIFILQDTSITSFITGLNIGNIMLDATQNVAKHVSVVLRDATGNGAVINSFVLASLVFKIKKGGTTTYSTITPVATAVGTTGLLDIALTASHLDTLGVAAINITGAGILTNDDLFVDVVAINKNDAVRSGLTALPNATAGASGGLPTFDSNLNVHSDLQRWIGTTPDVLSSGKIAADLKLWLTAAPASLSTNGFVKSILLRWLTDDAGGTPSALSTGNVPVPAVDVSTVLTILGTPAGASVSADVAAVKSDTAGIATLSTKVGTPAGASVSADIAAVQSTTSGLSASGPKIDTLHQIAVGRWKVEGTQLLLFDSDNTTVLKTFDLLDDAGDPSNLRIFERVPSGIDIIEI